VDKDYRSKEKIDWMARMEYGKNTCNAAWKKNNA